MIKHILVLFRNLIYGLVLFPYVLFYKNKKGVVFTECYMSGAHQKFKNNNWGDDLNKYLFEYISEIKIVNLPFTKMLFASNVVPYSLIGSIITFYKLSNKIVYGTGIRDPQATIMGRPREIISVRGPRTRRALIDHGIDCPEKFGDPVLLLPLFYTPQRHNYNRGGLVLNMGTDLLTTKTVQMITAALNLKIISMTDYNQWTDVIDEICSCDFIVSESLHGLIVAETYAIPNVWVEFINHPSYWDFKFIDFYESIGKEEQIIRLNDIESIDDNLTQINNKLESWKKGQIDYNELLDLYPFDIKISLKDIK